MSRVNIESSVWTDLRFKKIAKKLNISLPEVIGRMAMIWHQCTSLGETSFSAEDVDIIADRESFSKAIIDAELGRLDPQSNRIYMAGSHRCLWKIEMENSQRKAGTVRAAGCLRDQRGKFKSHFQPQMTVNYPAPPAPSSAPTPTPTPTNEKNSINHHSEIRIRPEIEVPDDGADFLGFSNKGGTHGAY